VAPVGGSAAKPPSCQSKPTEPKGAAPVSDDERRAIYEALKGQQSGSAFNADIGTELPPGIELRPVPDDLAARVPQTKDYSYAVTHDRVLLVGTSRVVAGVFADANVPVSQGRRGP
jgi:hypothetical protein